VTTNPFDLTGKVVLVTGANSGLGLGWANAVAGAGADVVIWGRRTDANERAAEELRAHGGRVLAQSVDVSVESQVVDGVAAALEEMGRLDGAIANAGLSTTPPSFAELDSHMLARTESGDGGGSLITCGSLTVTDGVPRIAHYAAAKAALAGVTRSLAVELGPHGIRANMVLPGRIATNLGGTTPEEKHAQENRARVIPIPRFGTPEDCAGIVVYLLSDAASYHTGDLITVDGGLSVTLPS
jgi:NAD(P)-dependent dehydrogenase (short-subunit alcohol dehydrogenase family)